MTTGISIAEFNTKVKNLKYIYYILSSQTINHIQNKSFCLHNICACSVYIYYVYINAHTYSTYFENIYMFRFI